MIRGSSHPIDIFYYILKQRHYRLLTTIVRSIRNMVLSSPIFAVLSFIQYYGGSTVSSEIMELFQTADKIGTRVNEVQSK